MRVVRVLHVVCQAGWCSSAESSQTEETMYGCLCVHIQQQCSDSLELFSAKLNLMEEYLTPMMYTCIVVYIYDAFGVRSTAVCVVSQADRGGCGKEGRRTQLTEFNKEMHYNQVNIT